MPYFTMIGSDALPYPVVIGGVLVVAMIIGVVSVIGTNSYEVRGLSQWAWLIVVVAFPLIGLLFWLILGRPRRPRRRRPSQSARVISEFPEYDRKGRFVPNDPVADAAFLRQCRERAEQQRRHAEIERRRREERGY